MKRFIPIFVVAGALTAPLAAQDTTVQSRTEIEADDATAVSMIGCLRHDHLTGRYTLAGTLLAAGDEVKTTTKVETDVDDDDVEVKTRTRVEADDAVGTSGAVSTYVLVPRAQVSLTPHVGKQVQISAVMLKPGEDDAEVEIKEKTTVDAENGSDRTSRSRTEIEVENVRHGQYAVLSVKALPGGCSAQ